MKAIQITAPGELKVVEVNKPVMKDDEILIKIKST